MITVYHLANSRSARIVWLLEELGLEYNVERFERDPQTQRAPAEMKRLHPLGRSPMLRDDDLLLVESGAIVDYLVTRYGAGRLEPATNARDYSRYLQWFHFAEGSAMAALINLMYLDGTIPGTTPSPMAGNAREEVGRQLDYMNGELATRPYFAGSAFTAADVMMTMPVSLAANRGLLEGRTHLNGYLERVTSRPAYVRASEV